MRTNSAESAPLLAPKPAPGTPRTEALDGDIADGSKVVTKMKSMPTEDPLFGKGVIRADGAAIHTAYLFEVKKPEESKRPWDYYKLIATIPGEEAFRPMADGGCPLVK